MPAAGELVLFLHAHLPFVRHPEHEDFLEEDWLYEAISETYLPLWARAARWREEGVPARVTISLTPTLCEMLRDELLVRRYVERTSRLVDLSDREISRLSGDERFLPLARMYRDRFSRALEIFEGLGRDLVGGFARLQSEGVLEIAGSAATHAFLPLLIRDEAAARAQIRLGARAYREHFGADPPGFWLPECGFAPGLDAMLAGEGITYFITDAHAVLFAKPAPVLGASAPIVCPSGVLAFPRDPESSRQVWSADEGYPGDPRYREFHRDAGWDLPPDALGRFVLPTGARRNVGIKYHRITARDRPLHAKEPYDPHAAQDALESHAAHFVGARVRQARALAAELGRAPILTAPYDAELFGHWWFEGPDFLDRVVRLVAERADLALATPGDVIRSGRSFQLAEPACSSWGNGGYAEVWLNEKNDWIWPRLFEASARMRSSLARAPEGVLEARAVKQLARELVLASASDWPFILSAGTSPSYAERRVREHLDRFEQIHAMLEARAIDEARVAELEAKDNLFPYLDPRDFA